MKTRKRITKEQAEINYLKVLKLVIEGLTIENARKRHGIPNGSFYNHITKDQKLTLSQVKRSHLIHGTAEMFLVKQKSILNND